MWAHNTFLKLRSNRNIEEIKWMRKPLPMLLTASSYELWRLSFHTKRSIKSFSEFSSLQQINSLSIWKSFVYTARRRAKDLSNIHLTQLFNLLLSSHSRHSHPIKLHSHNLLTSRLNAEIHWNHLRQCLGIIFCQVYFWRQIQQSHATRTKWKRARKRDRKEWRWHGIMKTNPPLIKPSFKKS